jgi:hypothetical protein
MRRNKKPVSRDSTLEENSMLGLEGILGSLKADSKIRYFSPSNTGFTPFTPHPIVHKLRGLMIYSRQPE